VWLMQLLQQSLFGLWFIARGQVSWKGVVDATTEDETSLVEGDLADPPIAATRAAREPIRQAIG